MATGHGTYLPATDCSIYRSAANQCSYAYNHQYLDGRSQRGVDVSGHIVPWCIVFIRGVACSVDHSNYFRFDTYVKWLNHRRLKGEHITGFFCSFFWYLGGSFASPPRYNPSSNRHSLAVGLFSISDKSPWGYGIASFRSSAFRLWSLVVTKLSTR